MSERQYYEFVAIDQPLTRSEMAELRSLSSRATTTATSFVNEYSHGTRSERTRNNRIESAFGMLARFSTSGYKGRGRQASSKDDRLIGERSEKRCRFVMIKDRQWDRIEPLLT